MDDLQKKNGATEVLGNKVFQHFYEEQCSIYRKTLEFGDPNNPDAILDANKALRELRKFHKRFEASSKLSQGESE